MLIELNEVSFCYSGQTTKSLRQISCQIEEGEFVVLAGTNGSGKSTLLRLLNGLIPNFYTGNLAGQIRIAGQDPTTQPVHQLFGQVALLSQNPAAQFFSPTVRRELAFGLESLGLSYAEISARIAEIVEFFSLHDLLERRPDSLSGGEQQRVLLAALIALRPKILALDEPFAALDYSELQHVNLELDRLNQSGITILVAEQRLEPLLKPGRRCLLLEQGCLVADTVVQKLFEDSGHTTPQPLLTPLMGLFEQSGRAERPFSIEQAAQICRQEQLTLQSDTTSFGISAPLLPENSLVKLADVSLTTPNRSADILTEVSLDFKPGQRYALLGRNGAGKTTLARHLSGFHPAKCGTSLFASKPIYRQRRGLFGLGASNSRSDLAPGRVGLLFQNPNLQLFLPTVREELELGLRLLGRGTKSWLTELIERLELAPLLERNPLTLSGGEKKRVVLACTLATEPELLLLDEPSAGLDYRHQRQVNNLLLDFSLNRGATMVLITHDLTAAAEITSRWLILAQQQLTCSLSVGSKNLACQTDFLARHGLQPPIAATLAANLGQVYPGGPPRLVAAL